MDTPNILGLQVNTKVFFLLIYYRSYLCLKKALFQVFWKYFFMYLNTSICVFLLFDMTCIFTEQKSFLIALLHISTRDGWAYVVLNTLQTFFDYSQYKIYTPWINHITLRYSKISIYCIRSNHSNQEYDRNIFLLKSFIDNSAFVCGK